MQVDRAMRKTRVGQVVSNKMDKTVVISVEAIVAHKAYGRTMRKSNKFKAHDENNQCQVGDQVMIMETRPLSKDKRWRVVEILEKTDEI